MKVQLYFIWKIVIYQNSKKEVGSPSISNGGMPSGTYIGAATGPASAEWLGGLVNGTCFLFMARRPMS